MMVIAPVPIQQLASESDGQATTAGGQSTAVTPQNLSPTLPNDFLLGFLRDGRFRVHSPIQVNVARENEHFICESPELNEFGFGPTLYDAVADLQRAIAQLYQVLEQEQDRLGTDLQGVWAELQRKVSRR